MSTERVEWFYGNTFNASRGECLRALVAAIYRTAKTNRLFTTDAVFAELGTEYNEHDFRVTTGKSKLIAVALKKVCGKGDIAPVPALTWESDSPISHSRPKQVWQSNNVQV